MTTIGFSTGAIARDDFVTALDLLEPTNTSAVELSALRAPELPPLLAALPGLLPRLNQRYRYVSFHAPTKFNDEQSLVQQLMVIADLGLNIVVHPDTIGDFDHWRGLGSRLCLENMDSRKPIGRTAEELEPFFEMLPEARLCLDLAHARQIDSSMNQAVRILRRFANRLTQFHISEINSKGAHFPMSFAAIRAYEPFATIMSRTPVIIESMVGPHEIVREIAATEELVTQTSGVNSREFAA
ncbi:hypothetical protein [Xaviernesmea rhizosphaerae]|uniref:hypothetical protein n=1 Tax=Xaviernesmea rhizosphaerae TaxID=1672749 RepID=UPI00094FCF31|nr:hypothetical protein [Xaviernesmea rhizosphaerae]